MLDANENESKNAKPLAEWVDEQTSGGNRKRFLEDHLIPDVDLSLENFASFIENRKALLVSKLKALIN